MAGTDRTSVYWGVEPYPKGHEGFAPYVGWEQAHARDLGDSDFNLIMKSAREWLQTPILKDATKEMLPDIRFRAALDLSLRMTEGGKYSVGLHPDLYNKLLARLAGVSGEGTLLTVREASNARAVETSESVYHPRRERTIMRASTRIRQYATKFANTQPEVAFDLLDLASKVAEDEQAQAPKDEQAQDGQQKQGGELPPALKEHMEKKKEEGGDDQDQGQQKQAYRQLRAATIKAANENPATRPALMPLLKLIKQLG